MSAFDVDACDVAPDGAGDQYTGAITARNVLAILTSLVRGSVNAFRVGWPR